MKLSLRRLLSRLTAIALTASAVPPVAAVAAVPTQSRRMDATADDDDDWDGEDTGERELVSDLPIDPEHIDPSDAAIAIGRGLAMALGKLRPLHATQIAATWAVSEDPVRRLSLANALEWTFPLVGDAMIIEHLAKDPDAEIRASVARAAWARRATGGDAGVLARLSDDQDPTVRAIARGAR
ncbi:MAG TPA: hypothetical protein VGM39_02035 [Kofleriaceae bacterium]|jgi:hypothetical protein